MCPQALARLAPSHSGGVVFDDRVEHEAWNLTPEPRIVLLLDFVPGV